MDLVELAVVRPENEERITMMLRQFVAENSMDTQFCHFLTSQDKQCILSSLLQWLQVYFTSTSLRAAALKTIKILCRENIALECLGTELAMMIFMKMAQLKVPMFGEEEEDLVISKDSETVILEAQKCMCNLVFYLESARRVCSTNGCIEAIVHRMKTYKDPHFALMIKYYDMRLLFVITFMTTESRVKLLKELHGLIYLVEVLDLIQNECQEMCRPMKEIEYHMCAEVLKTLFNITSIMDKLNLDCEEEAHCQRLVSILHDIIIKVDRENTKEMSHAMICHCIGLLTNMPPASYDELYTPDYGPSLSDEACAADSMKSEAEKEGNVFEEKNMTAIDILLMYLDEHIDFCSEYKPKKEMLSNGITCLIDLCRANKFICDFCRWKIFPCSAKKAEKLPNQGCVLRTKLITLFGCSTTGLQHLTAEFCFVVCRKSARCFTKYTGQQSALELLPEEELKGEGSFDADSEISDDDEDPYQMSYEMDYDARGLENKRQRVADDCERLTRFGIMQSQVAEAGHPGPLETLHELYHNCPEIHKTGKPHSDFE